MSTPIRIAIVDPHDLVRDSLKFFFQTLPDVVCVGEAASMQAALPLCQQAKPDILLFDFAYHKEWIELLEPIRQAQPGIKVLVLSTNMEPDFVQLAWQHQVDGYLVKMTDGSALEHAVRAISQGQQVIDPDLPQSS